jgi:CIC family chloride channel protein
LALCCVPALLCGVAGLAYMRLVGLTERWTARRRGPRWSWAALGGLVAGALGCAMPEVLGSGDAVISQALAGAALGPRGAMAAGAKIAATAATLGTGGSGGAFMPALFIGSALGNGCRGLLHRGFHIEAPRGLFALVGMSCALTAAYRAPLTAIVMALEIARGPEALGPVMLAVALTHLVTRREPPRPAAVE